MREKYEYVSRTQRGDEIPLDSSDQYPFKTGGEWMPSNCPVGGNWRLLAKKVALLSRMFVCLSMCVFLCVLPFTHNPIVRGPLRLSLLLLLFLHNSRCFCFLTVYLVKMQSALVEIRSIECRQPKCRRTVHRPQSWTLYRAWPWHLYAYASVCGYMCVCVWTENIRFGCLLSFSAKQIYFFLFVLFDKPIGTQLAFKGLAIC